MGNPVIEKSDPVGGEKIGETWYKLKAWKVKIIAVVLVAIGLGLTGFYMKLYRMFNGDFSDITIPSTAQSFGTLFMFSAPILWRLAKLL